ncbi:MAG TPA: TetR/AcrR family transcriptional regulator [Magnetospirillaceae bacterium]|jgi:AcrR family transcriptional regulator
MPHLPTTTTRRNNKNPPTRGRGGRPSRDEAEKLGEKILAVATELFLAHGYGATSIEMVARGCGIAKRTFYHRFPDKAALFAAVVRGIVGRLRPQNDASLFVGATIEEIMLRLAKVILHAALTPEGLGLYRVIVAEAGRFPELAAVVASQGASQEGIARIGALLERAVEPGRKPSVSPAFAAAQFLFMVIALPQRRALGLGTPMTEAELDIWARDTVTLFLNGWRGLPADSAR